MNSIRYTYAPLQKLFAVLAIFALVAMPMTQVFAQEATEPVTDPVEQAAPQGNPSDYSKNVNDDDCDAEMTTADHNDDCDNQDEDDDCDAEMTTADHNDDCDNQDEDDDCDRVATSGWNNDNDCDEEDRDSVTIVAEKIVCTDEADLPNWGNNIPAKIDGNTAANWLVDHKSCKLVSGWDFEWGLDGVVSDPGGTKVGTAGGNWQTFGSTDGTGMTKVELSSDNLQGKSKIWLREVLKDNYLSFSDLKKVGNTPIGESVSAEFYCNTDGLNYDNYEWIDGIKDGIKAGTTYNCVAWNVPEKGSITIKKEVVGDVANWSFNFSGMDDGFTLSDKTPSQTFSDLTTGKYTFDEVDTPGWDLTSATCDDTDMKTTTVQDISDLVVDLGPGEDVTCTFTNTKEVPQIPVCQTDKNLLKNGSFEVEKVTNESKWQQFDYLVDSIDWVVKKVSDSSNALLEFHRGWNGNVAADQEQYVELDGNQPTRISQDVVTEKGATYKLSWAFAPRQDTVAAENNLGIEVEGVQVDAEGPTAGVGVLTLEKWTSGEYEFVAGDALTEIAFKDLGPESVGGGSDVGTFLDDACLIKVKDPVVEPKVCTVTLVSGTDVDVNGSDDNTTVVEKSGALAKLLAPIHTAWTAAISGASWIWGDNPVADPVNGVSQTFERKFGWGGDTVTSAKLYVAADNSYSSTLNGDASGADPEEYNYVLAGQDGKDGQDEYDVTSFINSGNNDLRINVVNKPSSSNPAENPAGLMYKLVITGTGENCEVPYDDEPEVPVCSSFVSDDYDVKRGQDFNLSWAFGGDVDYVEIDGIEGTFDPSATKETSITSDTEFLLTAYAEGDGENEKLFTCSLDVDTYSGGNGGSSSSRGRVLGESTDTPEGGVAGASTEMPAGAPNTGAGGTSPVAVSLPTLLAIMNGGSSVRKTK